MFLHQSVIMFTGGMPGGGRVCVAGEKATAADGPHPTGIHSCVLVIGRGQRRHFMR